MTAWECRDLAREIEGTGEGESLPPIVDRNALLALADEMDELCGPWHDCGKHYARRIREACGGLSC